MALFPVFDVRACTNLIIKLTSCSGFPCFELMFANYSCKCDSNNLGLLNLNIV